MAKLQTYMISTKEDVKIVISAQHFMRYETGDTRFEIYDIRGNFIASVEVWDSGGSRVELVDWDGKTSEEPRRPV